jgi:DNA-directed RNA polymerase subunit N (RpoN/RPB10)
MLYSKCPSCKTRLDNKQIPLETEMKKICDNNSLEEDQQNKLKEALLNKLEIKRYCCRQRAITYVDLISVVK